MPFGNPLSLRAWPCPGPGEGGREGGREGGAALAPHPLPWGELRAVPSSVPTPPVPYLGGGSILTSSHPHPSSVLPLQSHGQTDRQTGHSLKSSLPPLPAAGARPLLLEKFYFAFVRRNIICCKLFLS